MKRTLVLFFAAHALLAQSAKPVGSIAGTITDAKSKKPITSALVSASRVGSSPFVVQTKSGGDGAYQLQRLEPGSYLVCVQASGNQYLNSCEWDGAAAGIVIGSVQSAVGINIALAPASVLNVQLADPRGALRQLTRDGRRPELNIGVWGPRGMYYPAREANELLATPGARDSVSTYKYQVAVPHDTGLRFQIVSRDLKIGDANGLALTEEAKRPNFQHSTGDAAPKSFSFTVLEKLP